VGGSAIFVLICFIEFWCGCRAVAINFNSWLGSPGSGELRTVPGVSKLFHEEKLCAFLAILVF
jgi:hypothetical protein